MFRRSALLFLGFGLLVLILIVGYAIAGLSGPETAVDAAEEYLRAGRPDKALTELKHAETSLGSGGHEELRRRIMLVRYEAHRRTKNYDDALASLDQLLRDKPDAKLEHQRLRVLILSGQPERARQHALKLLRENPDDGRTLELAGEATQRIYQEKLGVLRDELAAALPPRQFRDAVQALLPYLYRRVEDPVARSGKRRFDEILNEHRPVALVNRVYEPAISEIRNLVAQTQQYYRQSLEAIGTPVSAFRGLATGLEQGQRYDDVLALCEVYMRRFDHVFETQAAINAARIHLQAGRYRAVLEVSDRFLPPGSWRERLQREQIDSEIRHLLLYKAKALFALREEAELVALSEQILEMGATGQLELAPERHLIQAYQYELAKDPKGVDRLLGYFVQYQAIRAKPPSGEDLFVEAMRMRLDASEQAALDPGHIEWVLGDWIEARPTDPEPHLRRATYRLKLGQVEKALFDATAAIDLAGQDEEALHVYAEATDAALAKSSRGSEALLNQCLQLHIALPRVNIDNPALYLTLAERALKEEHFVIARESGKQAARDYNWARWPRYLWAKAAMAIAARTDLEEERQEQYEEAVQAMTSLRRFHPDDVEGLRLLRDARKAAGLPIDDLLYDLGLAGQPDPDVAYGLLENALRRGDLGLAAGFTKHIRNRYGRNPEVTLLVTDALASTGKLKAAQAILAPMARLLLAADSPLAPRVAERLIVVEAKLGNRQAVEALVPAARDLFRTDAEALVRIARALATHDQLHAAYSVLQPVLRDAEHRETRSGDEHLLAGELALQLGWLEEARHHFTAAVTFDDGADAGRALALLLIQDDELALAAEIPGLAEEPTNLVECALAARVGHPEVVDAWITETQQRNPLNLQAACLQAIRSPDARTPEAVREIAKTAPELLLDVMIFPDVPGFEQHGLTRAEELRDAFPGNEVARFLWAHAMAQAGKPDEALRTLRAIAERHDDLVAAWDEIVRIVGETHPEQLKDPKLNEKLAAVVQPIGDVAPPRLRALLLANFVAGLAGWAEPPDETVGLLAQLWLEFREETRAGLRELEALVAYGRYDEALQLFDALDKNCRPVTRPRFNARFATQVRKMIAADPPPEVLAALMQRVSTLVKRDGPSGGLVHVLLEQQDRELGPVGDSVDRAGLERLAVEHQLLEKHLALFREDKDPDVDSLILSIRRLERVETADGRAGSLRRMEDLLRWDPSLIAIWRMRARLLERDGRPDEAVAGLRWLFDYINHSGVLLENSRIAGQAGISTADDEQRLLRDLAPEVARSDAANFARGLLALRMGRYPEAAAMLANAEVRPDGAHLFYRALANLALPNRESGVLAGQLLTEFQEDYPDSPVCEIAGHLAKQLALPADPAVPMRGK